MKFFELKTLIIIKLLINFVGDQSIKSIFDWEICSEMDLQQFCFSSYSIQFSKVSRRRSRPYIKKMNDTWWKTGASSTVTTNKLKRMMATLYHGVNLARNFKSQSNMSPRHSTLYCSLEYEPNYVKSFFFPLYNLRCERLTQGFESK